MKNKWYLQTWFICLLFIFWYLIVPLIAGIVLVILQYMENKKLTKKYGKIDELEKNTNILESDYITKQIDFNNKLSQLDNKIKDENLKLSALYKELESLETDTICKQYIFSEYDAFSSEECKNKLALLKDKEQEAIKNKSILIVQQSHTVGKKQLNDNCKQILRCFNAECDNAILNLSVKNIDTVRNKIAKSFETLNKVFDTDGVQLSRKFLELKLEEMNLIYTYELKKEQEREQQKAIKEQMVEEEKVRREIERQKAKIEKDQTQCSSEINKLMSYMQKAHDDIERQLYIDKIKVLEERIKALEEEKATVLEREANARAGFVYVISNIGSFGEDIYKLGMTRRLEPMDRIKELSSASVPFEFDVHAMIFSQDAPELENILHKHFEKNSVNKVNLRKEFFKVSLEEIESFIKENYNNTVEFTKIPLATEYRQTLSILKSECATA